MLITSKLPKTYSYEKNFYQGKKDPTFKLTANSALQRDGTKIWIHEEGYFGWLHVKSYKTAEQAAEVFKQIKDAYKRGDEIFYI